MEPRRALDDFLARLGIQFPGVILCWIMGPWVYFSPLLVGAALMLALLDTFRAKAPAMPGWMMYLYLPSLVIAAGIVAQLLLIGMQGVRAQVLPVPFGKSIRGSAAAWNGYLILGSALLGVIAFLLGSESVTTAAWIVAVFSIGMAIGAVLLYVWSLPAAMPDFRDEKI